MTDKVIPLQKLVRGLIRRVEKARGKDFDFLNFEDRLMVQKITYLLVKAGIIRGLSFNYYLRGPYCPELLKMLKDTAENRDLTAREFTEMRNTEIKLDPKSEKRFQQVLDLLKKKNWDVNWLEWFTSGLFFAELELDPRKPNWKKIQELLAFKKGLKKSIAAQIVDEIKKYIGSGLFTL